MRYILRVFLLLVVCGLYAAIGPDLQIKAAGGQCIRVNQPPTFDELNAPPLSPEYLINPQTQAITRSSSLVGMPSRAIAPDGQHAVYWQAQGATIPPPVGMYLYAVQTEQSTLLTTLDSLELSKVDQTWSRQPDYDWGWPARWSPDSRSLAYVGYASPDSADTPYLGVIKTDGTQRQIDLSALPHKPQGIVIHGWSADSRYLAFSAIYATPDPTNALWVWDADKVTTPLFNVHIAYDVPRGMGIWTPTGHRLVILNRAADSGGDQLTLWSPEKGILSQAPWYMRFGAMYWLEWSPDGKQLVSKDFDLESAEYDLIYGYTADRLFNTTGKITRTAFSPVDGDANYRHTLIVMSWFANGDALLVDSNNVTFQQDLVRLNLATNVDTVLQSSIKSATPSPDGKFVVFVYERDGKDSVDLIEASGALRRFTTLDASPFGPFVLWSGDSRYVAFLGVDGGTVLPNTLIVSADAQHQWTILGADFFWIEPAWLVYTKIAGGTQTVQLLNLKTNQTFALGKITLEVPIPYASLSPDEKKIVYRSGPNELTLYFLDSGHSQTLMGDGFQIPDPIPGFSNGHQRYYGYDRSPSWLKTHFAWSPDSSYFAYWGFRFNKNETQNMLRVLAVDAIQTKQLDTYNLAAGYGETFSLSWNQCP